MSQLIKIKNVLFTWPFKLPTGIIVVEIGDQCIASGGFGFIYECISLNGKEPSPSLLIKVLKVNKDVGAAMGYLTIVKLQQRIKASFHKVPKDSHKFFTEFPALKAFPEFSFTGELNGKEVCGYSTANLMLMGFSSLDDILNGTRREGENFKNLSFHKRFQLCFHLANGFNLLSDLNYVHADINPKNIFINTISGESAIIDYDGGGLLEQPQDDTLTHGKLEDGEWLAPEIYEKLESNQYLKVDKYCDQWSISVAFHYLLFGYDPFFFIREQSKKCKEDYLNASKFYPIDVSNPNVSENALFVIEFYYNTIQTEIPIAIHEAMIINYTEGFFNPNQRTSYLVWMELFKQTQNPPVIDYFRSNKNFALKGTQIKLSWKVSEAIELTIDNEIGDVTGKSEITVRPDQPMTYWFKARGHFGEVKHFAEVSIFPVPLLEYLKVPTPDFESSIILPEIVVEFPRINLSIQLDKGNLTETPTIFIPLSDELSTVRPMYGKGSIFPTISYVFDKIKQAIISN